VFQKAFVRASAKRMGATDGRKLVREQTMSDIPLASADNLAKERCHQIEFPPEFDCAIYRNLHSDLARMSDEQLRTHYETFGRAEGRAANKLVSRTDFVALIPNWWRILEIGTFCSPVSTGSHVAYCDVFSQEELKGRAAQQGLNPETVPAITYLLGPEGLDGVSDNFHAIVSSHNIEHQPNIVGHLQQVERRLQALGGRFFILIPDKRYCFDRFIPESSIAQVIDCYENRRSVHSLQSVIEHRAMTTNNDSGMHWQDIEMQRPKISEDLIKAAIAEWRAAKGDYVDVHAWYFTPDSFCEIINTLHALGLTSFQVERIYSTRYACHEFWTILKA